jgi:hypothetical protein
MAQHQITLVQLDRSSSPVSGQAQGGAGVSVECGAGGFRDHLGRGGNTDGTSSVFVRRRQAPGRSCGDGAENAVPRFSSQSY